MSKTKEVKKMIIEYLSDGDIHNVAEIKEHIRRECGGLITEGVIAGSFKTLTTSGVIENVDRGKYRLICSNQEETNANLNNKSVREQIENLTSKYREEAIRIINTLEIVEGNQEAIMEGMSLRKEIDIFCDKIIKESD